MKKHHSAIAGRNDLIKQENQQQLKIPDTTKVFLKFV